MAEHARPPSVQPVISTEPKVAIACLGNGPNVAHARYALKAALIERIKQVAADPDATFAILKHGIEAGVRKAFLTCIGGQRG